MQHCSLFWKFSMVMACLLVVQFFESLVWSRFVCTHQQVSFFWGAITCKFTQLWQAIDRLPCSSSDLSSYKHSSSVSPLQLYIHLISFYMQILDLLSLMYQSLGSPALKRLRKARFWLEWACLQVQQSCFWPFSGDLVLLLANVICRRIQLLLILEIQKASVFLVCWIFAVFFLISVLFNSGISPIIGPYLRNIVVLAQDRNHILIRQPQKASLLRV